MGLFPPRRNVFNTKGVGSQSEAHITTRLLEVGYNVLQPLGDNLRYDLVIEDAEGHFWRVQCKTGRYTPDGAVQFHARTGNGYYRGSRKPQMWRSYKGEVEYFACYCPALGKVYLVPVDHVGESLGCLRVKPAKSNQQKNIHWAADYEL